MEVQLQHLLTEPVQWLPAVKCQKRIRTFLERTAGKLTPRLPMNQLAVAMLGGTGTGKSTLINAILGTTAVSEGKSRPTTHQPVLVCHTDADVSAFGGFEVKRLNSPLLEGLIVIDCPDPDTAEESTGNQTNTALLRQALPYCDVIIVTATQQKYRSKCVLDELADAAPGARLIFVQTHADKDTDIREDWRLLLQERYETGQMYFVDSHSVDSRSENDDLLSLRQLLTKELSGDIARRIRQANFYSLSEETVADCRNILETNRHSVQTLRDKIAAERRRFALQLTKKMQSELVNSRQILETKLIARISVRWGYSPFSMLLRLYQKLGTILSGAILMRVRSPSQLALWGTYEGVRQLRQRRKKKRSLLPPLSLDEMNQLKESGLILTGFAADAQLPAANCCAAVINGEAETMYAGVLADISSAVDETVDRMAVQYSRRRFRWLYETLLSAMLFFLLARPAKNFFVDSFFFQTPMYGIDYYLIALFWLAAWSAVLLFFFTFSLRKGIVQAIQESALDWVRLGAFDKLFSALDRDASEPAKFQSTLESIQKQLIDIKTQAGKIDKRLGRVHN
ncbi:MAG: GTPase domain-containing protein [Planctomycetaceae bacterium]|nr:GTPase domain-containing protein [Planctomycetaceae bacterium]